MFFALRNKIEEIREADLQTRKRWLIASSAAAMIIIVMLWLMYLNITVIPATETAHVKTDDKPGIFTVLGAGLQTTTESMTNTIYKIMNIFTEGRSFEINR